MVKRDRIMIDIDGCIADLRRWELANLTKYFIENDIDYNIDTKSCTLVESEKADEAWNKLFSQYVTNVKVMEYASEAIYELAKRYEIFIVTGRTGDEASDISQEMVEYLTRRWLENNNIEYDVLRFIKSDYKYKYVDGSDIKYVIEDSPSIGESILKETKAELIVFDADYNRGLDGGTRVYSWYEALKYFNIKDVKILR